MPSINISGNKYLNQLQSTPGVKSCGQESKKVVLKKM